jgi:hypothetical protein
VTEPDEREALERARMGLDRVTEVFERVRDHLARDLTYEQPN